MARASRKTRQRRISARMHMGPFVATLDDKGSFMRAVDKWPTLCSLLKNLYTTDKYRSLVAALGEAMGALGRGDKKDPATEAYRCEALRLARAIQEKLPTIT